MVEEGVDSVDIVDIGVVMSGRVWAISVVMEEEVGIRGLELDSSRGVGENSGRYKNFRCF